MNSNSNYQIGQAAHREYEMRYSQGVSQKAPTSGFAIHGRVLNLIGSLVSLTAVLSLFIQIQ